MSKVERLSWKGKVKKKNKFHLVKNNWQKNWRERDDIKLSEMENLNKKEGLNENERKEEESSKKEFSEDNSSK